MADYRTPADDVLPTLNIQDSDSQPAPAFSSAMTSEDPANSQTPIEEKVTVQDNASIDLRSGNGDNQSPVVENAPQPAADPAVMKQVEEVLASEQGIPTLLTRLKQSIASAKEFALFLKKRAALEEDHAQSLKKLCRLTQESIRKPEQRQGTFAQIYEEMTHIHERMAENGIQFAAALHQMQDELTELANNSERTRKVWKTNGLSAEQKVVDLETAMRKSKTKYDSLADEYDRARTGEGRGGGKVLGAFKAHKSAAQQEEELLRKVQAADTTYHNNVTSLQTEKAQLQSAIRPDAVKALQEAVSEIDSGVTYQMQKFASSNERLLLGNGLIMSPFKNPSASPSQPRSLRVAVSSINNEKDLHDYIAGSSNKVLRNVPEIKYERHPVLNPPSSTFSQPMSIPQTLQATVTPGGLQSQQPPSMGSRTGSSSNFQPQISHGLSPNQGLGAGGAPEPIPTQQNHNRSYSQNNMLNQPPPQQQQYGGSWGPTSAAPRYGNGGNAPIAAAPQLGALSFQDNQSSPQRSSPQQLGPPYQPPAGPHAPSSYGAPSQPPPTLNVQTSSKPVFGVHLGRLYERDGLAVPMVVYQCIQAVDLFGLGVEGIYRQSGSMNHINRLKSMFDAESQSHQLDFRNPENFFHDVNSVTGLLKQFFRDLPDPLLTMEHHGSFINAAKHDDDVVRRDSLHAIINSLPDPNYATLRALMLHLHRVMDNSHINRMNSHNLAVILGPTLMGTDPSTAIADAGWQIKVIDTILSNTYQIFDED